MNELVRNFCIIAHIDHGKSTLADRFLEVTGALRKEEIINQTLDNMDLERERGITIKLHAVTMSYHAHDGHAYVLNLIDTPGHVDFAYEVSRSLAACEGAILVVDASQGVEAQTLANVYQALDHDLEIVPVINKIDLPSADVAAVRREIEEVIGLDASEAVPASAKEFEVQELGVFAPHSRPAPRLIAGDVGVLVANVKDVRDAKVGDTITGADRPTEAPFPGFRVVKPMVFSGVFPIEAADYDQLRDALVKLRLNDSAFTFEPETSQALGFGFRCGYLGLLHMEIVQERLEREYDLHLITTAPSVVYRVTDTTGAVQEIDNPARLPPPQRIAALEEPILTCHIHGRTEDVGAILKLCQDRRGVQKDLKYLGTRRVQVSYDLPLAEVVFDFFDKLKTVSRGYASLDYELKGYQEADLVKLDILINGEPVDALSVIVHRERAYQRGRDLCQKLREVIPKQMFEVAIQAAIGAKVIARETVKAYRKNVLAKCYGGDITRKRKLLERQKEGKRRMKQVGSVEIPQEAFLAVLRVEG